MITASTYKTPSFIHNKSQTWIILVLLQLLLANNDAFTAVPRNTNRPTKMKPALLRHYQSTNIVDSSKQQPARRKKQADLITFDLDDTLFPVAPVIRDANEALVQRMKCAGYDDLSEQDINDTTKYIRTALKVAGEDITYTELRTRVIQKEMDKRRPSDSTEADDDDDTASQFYERWERERHASAERNLYADAIPMLQRLRMDHPSVIIGAITNGKGNPFEMKTSTLSDYFDFSISGEDPNVFPLRKPHAGIYEVALEKYREIIRCASDDGAIIEGGGTGADDNEDSCNWFHVGDDLANDVGASAACGAAAIWVDLVEAYGQTAKKRVSVDLSSQPSWSTASKEDLDKRRIMGDKARESVTARIERLSDLPDAILRT